MCTRTARERVQVGGQRCRQGLAFAGAHLRDLAFMQRHAADQLDVVGALGAAAARRFAHGGEGFGQQVVQRLAIAHALFEGGGEAGQLGVRARLHGLLQAVDAAHHSAHALELAHVAGADDLADDAGNHLALVWQCLSTSVERDFYSPWASAGEATSAMRFARHRPFVMRRSK